MYKYVHLDFHNCMCMGHGGEPKHNNLIENNKTEILSLIGLIGIEITCASLKAISLCFDTLLTDFKVVIIS